ncbi:MAG TPA: transcriptional regulator [Pirellulales bacterium]|nr:transcriptional regulator [Pirellulales bacterium]
MTQAPRIVNAAAEELPQDLIDLTTALERLPAEHREVIQPLLNRVIDSTRRRRRILHLVQDALSQLRLDMKYLLFDLEATRRESDNYRRRSEQG